MTCKSRKLSPPQSTSDFLPTVSYLSMSLPSRPLGSHLRHTSFGGNQSSSGHSALLAARITEKKAELEQLKQLKDLSAALATQMETLQEKLSTLSDGTEGNAL